MKTEPEPEIHSRTGNEKEQSEKTKIKRESFSFKPPNALPSFVLPDAVSGCVVLETVNSRR